MEHGTLRRHTWPGPRRINAALCDAHADHTSRRCTSPGFTHLLLHFEWPDVDDVLCSGHTKRLMDFDRGKRYHLRPGDAVEKTVQLPLPLFGDSVVVRGVYYAAPVVGATTAAPAHCARGAWVSGDPSAVP
jgi:hypothetical protein